MARRKETTVTDVILSRLDRIDEKLDRIEIQTTKTNGKVTRNQNDIEAIRQALRKTKDTVKVLENDRSIKMHDDEQSASRRDNIKEWAKFMLQYIAPPSGAVVAVLIAAFQ